MENRIDPQSNPEQNPPYSLASACTRSEEALSASPQKRQEPTASKRGLFPYVFQPVNSFYRVISSARPRELVSFHESGRSLGTYRR
jgi:hypothetical protein